MKHLQIIATVLLVMILPTISIAMEKESEWEKIEKEGEQEKLSIKKTMEALMLSAEKSTKLTPIIHYLYTPTLLSGAYQSAPGNFNDAFLASARAGATDFQFIMLDKPIKNISLESVVNLINFFLFAAQPNDSKKNFDFTDMLLVIQSTQIKEKMVGGSSQKLYNFFKHYAAKNQSENLCDANFKEKKLLIHLRPDPKQSYRSYWLGNSNFKSFEIVELEKGGISIRPTDAKKLTVQSKPTKNIINITIKNLQETAQTLIFGL